LEEKLFWGGGEGSTYRVGYVEVAEHEAIILRRIECETNIHVVKVYVAELAIRSTYIGLSE